MSEEKLSTTDMLGAIKRSGYLLESETTKFLASKGYFVESNKTILDPLSKKSREIDLIAEYYNADKKYQKLRTVARAMFVFEIKNNLFPLVLLTKIEFSPNVELWSSLKEVVTTPSNLDYAPYGFYEELVEKENPNIFTQYCSFQTKKGKDEELMALHPEIINNGLSKIVQYCDDEVEYLNNDLKNSTTDTYFRHFVYLPIILIKDNLYELTINERKRTSLKKTEVSRLIYNYHYLDNPKTAVVFVVTKKGLNKFLEQVRSAENAVMKEMIKLKSV
jgi:hypothetical protein